MHHSLKAAALAGFLLALSGLVLILASLGPSLEEYVGLNILFNLRGQRPVPPEVVVVALDHESSEALGIPSNPLKWPRNLHAKLIEKLVEAKASVIAFDVLFLEPSSDREDHILAEALGKAKNVVLCEQLRKESIAISRGDGAQTLHAEKIIQPDERFANSAAALAPFPLPKIPLRVSQFWTFKTEAGSRPTLPFTAFQIYALGVYGDFLSLLESVSPIQAEVLPRDAKTILENREVHSTAASIREIFEDHPRIADEMLSRISTQFAGDPGKAGLLRSLIKAYMGRDSAFLNFYGPPGTIPTISFHRLLNPDQSQRLPDLKGKAVFVGLSEVAGGEQRDSFRTVFSRPDGTDLSGVEIAATAFANLLEDEPIRPSSLFTFMSICIIWGFISAWVSFSLSGPIAILLMAAAAIVYIGIAQTLFKTAGIWLPIAVPFGVQAPLALLSGFFWKNSNTKKERKQIRKAFGFFLPDKAIDQIMSGMRDATGIVQSHQIVYGSVLCSDGAQYTSLSERMSPKELNTFLNSYYETIFQPVMAQGGTVSDIVGDSMLAIWAKAYPDSALNRGACRAALGIVRSMEDFNRKSHPNRLDTRIGLHHGQLLLGTVGGVGHFEYRPVGDVVNTASRIEGLNKLFGTRILVSGEVIGDKSEFLTRELGCFLLYGKINPTAVFELICPMEEALEPQKQAGLIFSEALRCFTLRWWSQAEALLHEYLKLAGEDKAARFYLTKCDVFKRNPPGEIWDGTFCLDVK